MTIAGDNMKKISKDRTRKKTSSKKHKEEKVAGAVSTASGVTSFLGSYNICHAICMAVIGVLAGLGIIITGFPLAFLVELSPYLWSIALASLAATIFFYSRHRACISPHLLVMNAGILLAAFPFTANAIFFWITGGGLALSALFFYLAERNWR